MRRLTRRLSTLCTLLSIALLVAASAMWVRSYWRHDLKMSKHGRVQRSVSSVLGTLRYLRVEHVPAVRPEHEDFNWYTRPVHPSDGVARAYGSRSRTVELLGFHHIEGDWRQGFAFRGEPPVPYRAIVVPYWIIVALAAVLPAWRLMAFARRRRRVARGSCTTCGYDLRASPERCPECGAQARGGSPATA